MHNSFSLLNEVRAAAPPLPRMSSVSEPSLRALVLDSQMSEEMRDGEAIKSLLASREELAEKEGYTYTNSSERGGGESKSLG